MHVHSANNIFMRCCEYQVDIDTKMSCATRPVSPQINIVAASVVFESNPSSPFSADVVGAVDRERDERGDRPLSTTLRRKTL